jgi:hypothetical protein
VASRTVITRARRIGSPSSASFSCAGLLYVALVLATACQTSVADSRRIAPADLDRLRFGVTTPSEVEGVFGVPDEREPDGALVYRGRQVGTHARWDENVTFRFQGGALSKVCRARS